MKNKLHYFMMLFCLSIFASAQLSPTTFSSKNLIANTGDQPYRMVSGDFNSDGHIDLIVTTYGDNTIELYSNDGSGNFSLHSSLINTLDGITGIKFVDLNGDTFEDIVACSYNNDKVVWFANDSGGGGNFGTEQTLPFTVNGASGLAVGTIDAGTSVDIAVSAIDDNTVVWFSNNGSGTFTGPNTLNPVNPLTSPDTITLEDLDGDTDLDALVVTGQYNSMNVVEIFRNNGTGTFTKDASVATGLNYISEAVPVDYDDDANLDILVTVLSDTPGTGSLIWYEDNGAGFTGTPITTSFGNPSMVRMVDLDDDGAKDLLVSSGALADVNDLIWFKNNGSGSFGSEQIIDNTQNQAYVFEVADFDNDTYLDIASSAYNDDHLNWFENLTYPLGIDDKDKDTFGIYPNPTFDKLNFSSTNSDDFNISIYDLLGKRVMEATKNVNSSLDISTLDSGIYILKLNDFNKTYKFIKQ
jgi:hypothetical protein